MSEFCSRCFFNNSYFPLLFKAKTSTITFRSLLKPFFFSSRRRHTILQGDWSSDVCSSDLLNKRLRVRPVPGRFSSMIYALFNPASGVLSFSNAGVPLPLLVSGAGCRSLGAGGFPSGMFADASYEIHSVQLAPGDAVLFATDGLHEMRNAQDEDLSWGKLEEIWQQCRCKSADECLDFLFDEVRAFSASSGSHDDMTAVVLKVPT